jgi:hypothetical protein
MLKNVANFVTILKILRRLYKIRHINNYLIELDMILLKGDAKLLEEYTQFNKRIERILKNNVISNYNCVNYNVDRVKQFIKKNGTELCKALEYRVCISCNRSLPVDKLKMINKLPVEIKDHFIFKKLLAAIAPISETSMICITYCLDDLKRDYIPKYSALNNMTLDITPIIIKELNFYENLLVHQAKCFQTIIQMRTLTNMNTTYKCPALKGTLKIFS